MAAPRSTPTTRMRELAERLRELRQAKDLTVDSVAQSLLVSPSKISRLETAQRRASPRDVRDLCLLYGVSNDERDDLMTLAAQALETSWYQDLDLNSQYSTFVGLEQAATSILTSQALQVPGLLQTEAYAEELTRHIRPPGHFSDARVAGIVESRMKRQALLSGSQPPRLHAVLDESVLRRPLGGPKVMADQIELILERTALSNVVVQVVPDSVGAHPGLDGRFAVLRFAPDQGLRDTVYIEGLLGELFLDKDTDVARYVEIFDYLVNKIALNEQESQRLLKSIYTHWTTSA